jgi:hypothetical protein
MKRWILSSTTLLAAVALVTVGVRADVKTTEHTTLKFEGMMGAIINRMAGGSDGITSTLALKGNRLARTTGSTGQIIDLGEQKVYTLDIKKKEYRVMTFAELRKQMEEARADMEKRQQEMSKEDQAKAEEAAKQLEFDVKVDRTNEHKSVAGMDTQQAVLTITMRQKGTTLEEGGGLVITNTMWLAPHVAAMDDIRDFNMNYFQADYGGVWTGMDLQQMNAVSALLAGFGPAMERMGTELRKLQGTPLATTMVVEGVKSAEQMKAAQSSGGGGGGIGGMLASRMMKRQTEQRTKALTSTNETLSIATTASADDVAIPAGFKEKK